MRIIGSCCHFIVFFISEFILLSSLIKLLVSNRIIVEKHQNEMAIVQKVNIVKFFNRNEVSAHLVIKFESKGCRQIVADLNRFDYGNLEESQHVSIS